MKYYFAPLEGITGYIFRNAYETYFNRQVDAYFTPFIAPSINRCINPKEKRDILPEHNQNIKTIHLGQTILRAETESYRNLVTRR